VKTRTSQSKPKVKQN